MIRRQHSMLLLAACLWVVVAEASAQPSRIHGGRGRSRMAARVVSQPEAEPSQGLLVGWLLGSEAAAGSGRGAGESVPQPPPEAGSSAENTVSIIRLAEPGVVPSELAPWAAPPAEDKAEGVDPAASDVEADAETGEPLDEPAFLSTADAPADLHEAWRGKSTDREEDAPLDEDALSVDDSPAKESVSSTAYGGVATTDDPPPELPPLSVAAPPIIIEENTNSVSSPPAQGIFLKVSTLYEDAVENDEGDEGAEAETLPRMKLIVTGPRTMNAGRTHPCTAALTNTGTTTARDVSVLILLDGERAQVLEIGDLPAGQTRQFPFELRPQSEGTRGLNAIATARSGVLAVARGNVQVIRRQQPGD